MRLDQDLFGSTFQNPVLLASGTCGYGQELQGIVDLDGLGGVVTKSVTPEPRAGNLAPRVGEFADGMINSVGLANVGVEEFRRAKLPWLAEHLRNARVFVNVAGRSVEDFCAVVQALEEERGFLGFELNASCPNVKEGGAAFATEEALLRALLEGVRRYTARPLLVKLAPNTPDIGRMAEAAVDSGADGLTLVNTYPGLLFDLETRRPVLGAGAGGVSGPAVLPLGVFAVARARERVQVPLIGVGGIARAEDAVQYFLAGASLVQIGTANFADPRIAERVLSDLKRFGKRNRITHLRELIGAGMLN